MWDVARDLPKTARPTPQPSTVHRGWAESPGPWGRSYWRQRGVELARLQDSGVLLSSVRGSRHPLMAVNRRATSGAYRGGALSDALAGGTTLEGGTGTKCPVGKGRRRAWIQWRRPNRPDLTTRPSRSASPSRSVPAGRPSSRLPRGDHRRGGALPRLPRRRAPSARSGATRNYRVVLRFDRESNVQRWKDSEERRAWYALADELSEDERRVRQHHRDGQERPLALALSPLDSFVRTSVSGIGLLLLGTAAGADHGQHRRCPTPTSASGRPS